MNQSCCAPTCCTPTTTTPETSPCCEPECCPETATDAAGHGDVKAVVRDIYGAIATQERPGCCGPTGCAETDPNALAEQYGYTPEALAALPEGTNLGLGCGNPHELARLEAGQTVLDLGCGAGFDCLLASRAVGGEGHVIGVDMTPAMVDKARRNAATMGADNVDIRLGEIENLPVADSQVDVILSNCVVNLSPDKAAVYREAFRVLRPQGRLAISDVVATAPIPDDVAQDLAAYAGCISGAADISDIASWLEDAGFADIRIETQESSRDLIASWFPGSGAEGAVVSALIHAVRPA